MNLQAYGGVLKEAADKWLEHKAVRLGAALAYYSVFSIAPLLIISMAICGVIFGVDAVQGHLFSKLQQLVGPQGAEAMQALVANARHSDQATLATIVSSFVLVFGAIGVFYQLRDALNTIWEVAPKPWVSVWDTMWTNLFDYFISLTMVVGIGFLLAVSLLVDSALAAASAYLSTVLPGGQALWHGLNSLVTFAVLTLMFATTFKFLPDVHLRWSDVWQGALLTSLLFIAGKFLIGWYIGNSSLASSYGAAGSLVAILVWVYYSSQILLFGAECTRAYTLRLGSGIRIKATAVPVTEDAKAQQGVASARQVLKQAAAQVRGDGNATD